MQGRIQKLRGNAFLRVSSTDHANVCFHTRTQLACIFVFNLVVTRNGESVCVCVCKGGGGGFHMRHVVSHGLHICKYGGSRQINYRCWDHASWIDKWCEIFP